MNCFDVVGLDTVVTCVLAAAAAVDEVEALGFQLVGDGYGWPALEGFDPPVCQQLGSDFLTKLTHDKMAVSLRKIYSGRKKTTDCWKELWPEVLEHTRQKDMKLL